MKIKNIKSVGWVLDDGMVMDDSKGIDSVFEVMFDEGEEVSFERGVKEVKKYLKEYDGMDCWEEMEKKLNELKKKNKGEKWVVWNVECDINLGFKSWFFERLWVLFEYEYY